MQNKNLKAPFFNEYFPRYNNMSQEQLEFYNIWREEMQKGNFLDIQGSIGYVFVYMYSLSTSDDYDEILQQLLLLKTNYSEYTKVNEYCNRWIADCYIVKNQFNEALVYVPNDINIIKNAGAKCGLDEIVKAHYGEMIAKARRHEHDEIITEIISMYKEFERENHVDTAAECITVSQNHRYLLFPGVPRIPTKEKNGEIDLGVQTDSKSVAKYSKTLFGKRLEFTFGILPKSITITFYAFDSSKFELFIPNCLKLAHDKISEKYKLSKSESKYNNDFDKWLYEHPKRLRTYNQKEVLGYEDYYLDGLAKSKHPIDKHYWLDKLAGWYYKNREYPGFIEKAVEYGLKDIEIFESCMNQYNAKDFNSLTSELGWWLRDPQVIYTKDNLVNSFAEVVKRLSTVYEKLKKYNEAIEICERAIKLGIKDTTTKGGLERRLAVLRKKL